MTVQNNPKCKLSTFILLNYGKLGLSRLESNTKDKISSFIDFLTYFENYLEKRLLSFKLLCMDYEYLKSVN